MDIIKKYHIYFWVILIIALLIYDNHTRNLYSRFYKTDGVCTSGTIKEIEGYGRGTGYVFVYTFSVNNKTYDSKTDTGSLNFNDARKLKGKDFLVVYLKSNVHVNRMYVSIPSSQKVGQTGYKNFLTENPKMKNKLEAIPNPGWFWENYF
ncbi:hypothetical protein SAMN05443633_102121 [Chryseobacterium arachidis]|uniref:DUF3592 domain-containing protein n=2 Tax=Chryseobacterium arachidis TaxID=1416778 RepID=A0A1M4WS41_9FLAO|nr:hypothetical protein SAMN05443633_102121 [Chryseobacterium arachidis]